MGEKAIIWYKKMNKEYKIAFFATFFAGLLIHFYKFVNTLPNHDSVYSYYSAQNVIGSGRWGLSIACGLSSYFDLPWINGILACVFIAITVVIITAIFKIKNPVVVALIGALFAASPSTTETFMFMFTADGYMVAMCLATAAVYLSRVGENSLLKNTVSAICVCITCSIYQAYVSFGLILAVVYFISTLLENKFTKKDSLHWIFRQVLIYSIGLVSYYVIWKIILHLSEIQVNSYQGISDVGKFSVSMIIHGFIKAIKTTILYFLQWNVLEHGWTLYSVLSVCSVVLLIIGLVVASIKSKIYKRTWAMILLVLSLLSVIPFGGIWHFMSETIGYGARMLQGYTMLFALLILLYEKWGGSISKNLVCIVMIAVVYNNALMANISYFYMNLSYERTYADGLEMVMEIHELENNETLRRVAVLGDRLQDVQWYNKEVDIKDTLPSGKIHTLSSQLEANLMTNSEHLIPFLNKTFGLQLESVSAEELQRLENTEHVKRMPCWPSHQGMTVIDNILVIKLSE